MPRKKKPAYDAVIRFRAFKNLEQRIERIVAARGYGDPADFMREGTTSLVREEERRLGLPPWPTKAVTYSKKRKKQSGQK